MLFLLAQWLSHYHHFFEVFQYLTLRAILTALTSLFIALLLGPALIRRLTTYHIGQVVRQDGPATHLSKAGTPTMGGALILVAMIISTLLWGDLENRYIWLLLFTLVGFGAIGWADDYLKLSKKNSKGLLAKYKMFWQGLLGMIIPIYLLASRTIPAETQFFIPFVKTAVFDLGIFYVVWSYIVIVGTSNAVNLTDGLDGLAILPAVMIGCALGVFAYLTGNVRFAHYLIIPYIPGTGEIAIICSAMAGAGLGFLWFNTYPAQVFMGDVGALGLGALLGTIAVIVRQELVLAWMGGIFVIEAISVILQVSSFKLTGKRLFRMAPLHHHFELKGWPEPRVIVRFWIITFILVLSGLATLKLR